MKPTHIIGIDNGLTGGIALINMAGKLITRTIMPTTFDAALNAKRIQSTALYNILKSMHWDCFDKDIGFKPWNKTSVLVGAEPCPKHSRDKAAMRSMAFSWGLIVSTLEAFAQPWTQVESGRSKTSWQTCLLGSLKKDQTKPAALALARKLWPQESFIAEGCRTPHSGMIDAALIAEHLRRIHL
jgi:hypothetical protein